MLCIGIIYFLCQLDCIIFGGLKSMDRQTALLKGKNPEIQRRIYEKVVVIIK
jgi:hypothetical protein